MNACPEPLCRKELEEVRDTLYDKHDGLNTKLSKKSLVAIAFSVAGIIAMFTVASLTAWGVAKDERKENAKNIAVITEKIDNNYSNLNEKLDTMFKIMRRNRTEEGR